MEKGSKVLVTILILLVLGLGGFIVYDKVLKDNTTTNDISKKEATKNNETTIEKENNKDEKNTYTYQEIKGLYEGKWASWTIHLYLEDDGTFVYDEQSSTHGSCLGNYIIEDNQIKLNSLFWEGNGAGLGVSSEDERLILLSINSDGSLTETQNNQFNRNEQIALTKTEATPEYQSGYNNFYNKINNTLIYNNAK